LPEKILRQRPKQTDMLTCKIALPDSPHRIIISKNLGFWAFISLDDLINTFFFMFGCWLLPEKFCVCPKNNGFDRLRRQQHSSPLMIDLTEVVTNYA